MKTTCTCCGMRATHEMVRSLGGTWYRCNGCNYAWRGLGGYLCSVIANIWWPVKGPFGADAAQGPLSGRTSSTRRRRRRRSRGIAGRGGISSKLRM